MALRPRTWWNGAVSGAEDNRSGLLVVERPKANFSRPRKVEPPVESSKVSGPEMERVRTSRSIPRPKTFEISTGRSTVGSRPRKRLEVRPFLPQKRS